MKAYLKTEGRIKLLIFTVAILASLFFVAYLFSIGTQAATGVPSIINYQGKLLDSNGVAVVDATYNFKLTIYDSNDGGNCLWVAAGACDATSTAVSVSTTNGVFSIELGGSGHNSIATSSIDFNTNSLYLAVSVESDPEMDPRKQLVTVPYAFNSDTVDGIHATSTALVADYLFALDSNGNFNLLEGGVSSTFATSSSLYLVDRLEVATTTGGGGFGEIISVTGNSYFDGQTTTTGSLWVGTGGSPNLIGFDFSGDLYVQDDFEVGGNALFNGNATTTGTHTFGSDGSGDSIIEFYDNNVLAFVLGNDDSKNQFVLSSTTDLATNAVFEWGPGGATSTQYFWVGSGGTVNLTGFDYSGDLYVQDDAEIDGDLLVTTKVGIATTTPGGGFGEVLTVAGDSYFDGRATTTSVFHAPEICIANDCNTTWPAGSGGAAWELLFTSALSPTTSGNGIFVTASSTFDSTLRVNSDLIVGGNATTSGTHVFGTDAASGDAIINFFDPSGAQFTLGNDDSTNLFTIASSTALDVNTLFTLDSSGNATFTGSLVVATSSATGYPSLVVDGWDGRVGVATTSPWGYLTVEGQGTYPELVVTGNDEAVDLIVDASGQVGIATTTPWRTLSVGGTVAFGGLGTLGATADALCLVNGGEVQVNSGTQDCTVSSERFKNTIEQYTGGLDTVMALDPSTFIYNGDDKIQIGLIAEEVEIVDPRLVTYNYDGLVQSVNKLGLITALISAVKNQQIQIDELKVIDSHPNNTQDKLDTVEIDTFYGTILVKGESTFESKVTFKKDVSIQGHLLVDADTAGSAVIEAGATSTQIIFNKPYNRTPKVVVNQTDGEGFYLFKVINKTIDGFTIVINQTQNEDISIDWIALANNENLGGGNYAIDEWRISQFNTTSGQETEIWLIVSGDNTNELKYAWSDLGAGGEFSGNVQSGLVFYSNPVTQDVVIEARVYDDTSDIVATTTISVIGTSGKLAQDDPSTSLGEELLVPEPVEIQTTTTDKIIEGETPTSSEEIVADEEIPEEPPEDEVVVEDSESNDEPDEPEPVVSEDTASSTDEIEIGTTETNSEQGGDV